MPLNANSLCVDMTWYVIHLSQKFASSCVPHGFLSSLKWEILSALIWGMWRQWTGSCTCQTKIIDIPRVDCGQSEMVKYSIEPVPGPACPGSQLACCCCTLLSPDRAPNTGPECPWFCVQRHSQAVCVCIHDTCVLETSVRERCWYQPEYHPSLTLAQRSFR